MSDGTRTVLWVVGEPGIGKTTFCRKLLATFGERLATLPRPKWSTFGSLKSPASMCAAAVGTWNGGKFDGGDTVPPSDIKPALDTYAELFKGYKLVLFDGDKFANMNAVKFVKDAIEADEASRTAILSNHKRPRLICIHLVGSNAAASGRLLRGTNQNASWIKGRRTKSARFAEAFRPFNGETWTIDKDAGHDPDTLIGMLRGDALKGKAA